MYDFMEYCLQRFYTSTGWNQSNQYSNLCWWSRSLLDFQTPQGMMLVLSRSPSLYFKPSYTLNALPVLNGSLGYLLTSNALDIGTSADFHFQHDYRHHHHHHQVKTKTDQEKAYLLYGRMFFPGALLESMYVGRISKEMQCLVTAVSNPTSHVLPQMAVQLQYDKGKWCTEGSFTSDDGLLGIRALYNIGQQPYQWSIGTEAYYGVMDKSGGLSTGIRYSTIMDTFTPPAAISFTYTLNPIVGHMSASYVVQASPELVLCSRYDFSIYSYESDLAFGLEYNATKKQNEAKQDVEKLEGLIKASWGFNKGLSLMWEGKWRNALVTLGLTSDSKHPIRSIGFEIQYFS